PEPPAEADADAEPAPPLEAVAVAATPAEATPAEATPGEAAPIEAAPIERVSARPPALAPAARRKHRERVFVAVAVVVVLAATGVLAAVTLSDRGGGGSPSTGGGPVEFTFDTISLASGATVERTWTLAGDEGARFDGTLEFANSTEERMTVSHTEVIPKTLAASVDDIDFEPEPVVIEADPVVRFDLEIPADGTITATYRISVAPDGTDESRLEEWADDLDAEEERRANATTTTRSTTTTTTTTTSPATTTTKPASGGGAGGGGGGNRGSGGQQSDAPTANPAPTPPASGESPPPPPPAPAPPPSPPTNGVIVVRAVSVEGNATFGFSGPSGSVQVPTAGSPNGSGQWSAGVAAGTYAWTEVGVPPGWQLFNLDCSDRDAGPFEHRSTISGATATFNVQPGEWVVCTWTNRRG
ncbi:MAG: prealbumin-like fold domain-containing protein, partial [Acidimicrobiia bacterium]